MKRMTKPAAKHSVDAGSVTDLNWRTTLSHAFSCNDELMSALHLPPDTATQVQDFPLRVPRSFVNRMQPGNPDNPLLRQVIPTAEELQDIAGYSSDPVDDLGHTIAPGVVQKYSGRALLIVTGACAIHCRYCFRRAYPYAKGSLSRKDFQAAIDVLTADTTIEEIILSGGDPLTLTNNKLQALLSALSIIPHIKRIRIHTRIPIVLPERIDQQLVDLISACPQAVIMVIHCNHAEEIDNSVALAMTRLTRGGVTLLNQSVLLHGINDSVNTLTKLSIRLFEIGVLPYYLHQLDPVAGAAHFNVEDTRAIELINAVSGQLPGYLVPRLVREIIGGSAKQSVHEMPQKGVTKHNTSTSST